VLIMICMIHVKYRRTCPFKGASELDFVGANENERRIFFPFSFLSFGYDSVQQQPLVLFNPDFPAGVGLRCCV
jgi:hypothetical protein